MGSLSFNSWLKSIAEAGRELLWVRSPLVKDKSIADLCEDLCSMQGEAVGVALANSVVDAYEQLDKEEKPAFFEKLLLDYHPDSDAIVQSALKYQSNQGSAEYDLLCKAVKSPRKDLFQRINMSPGGIPMLVNMRKDLQEYISYKDDLRIVDQDLKHLLTSWFNRGFLELRKIDWETSATILEKLIAYEAVHPMDGWNDLRSRLQASRRLYAFFHPVLESEPLIFVEVALVNGLATSIQSILKEGSNDGDSNDFDTAIFYSISNCQEGLKGISFGNFLIKQVMMDLMKEFSQIKQYATLSPIPGFTRWLKTSLENGQISKLCGEKEISSLLEISEQDWCYEAIANDETKLLLTRLCTHYLYNAKKQNKPLDPVARFHLGNGAHIEQINWLGDTSQKGLRQSAGLLVNYKYDLNKIEENHETYINTHNVACSKKFLGSISK